MAKKKGGRKKASNARKSARTSKKNAKLSNTKPEFYFFTIDGSKMKSLLDLADQLDKMSDDVFHYHVTEEKNDFSSWVRDVFEDHDLSKELVQAKARVDSQIKVLKHIVKKLTK